MDLQKLEYSQAEALGRSLTDMQWNGQLSYTPNLTSVTQGLFHYYKVGDMITTQNITLQWHHKRELLKYSDELSHYLDSLGYYIPFGRIEKELESKSAIESHEKWKAKTEL